MPRRFRRLSPFVAGFLAFLACAAVFAADPEPRIYIPIAYNPVPPPAASNNLAVSAATYLGGAGADSVSAIDIGLDGSLVVGGAFPGYTPGNVTPVALPGATSGAVLRLNSTGTRVLSLIRIGGKVNDLEIGGDGAIVACGDFGLAQLNAEASAVTWIVNPGEGRRCAVGSDGTAAVIANGNAYVYDADGNALRTWDIGGSAQDDIAVDGVHKLVIASGYTQKNVAGYCSGLLKVPFVKAWNYSGQAVWTNYDATAQQSHAAGQCADSRVRRVAIGRDGMLYLAGTPDGGNTTLARDPNDASKTLGTRQVKTDKFNDAYNLSGALTITWFGRYNPANGDIELGQFLLTRKDDNKGNSIAPHAITAAEDGTVYLSGEAYYQIANRDRQTVGGTNIGEYEGGEGFLLVVSPDLKTRLHWTVFAGPGSAKAGSSPATGVAVRGGVAALGISFNPGAGGRGLVTENALQPSAAGGTEGYIAAWPAK